MAQKSDTQMHAIPDDFPDCSINSAISGAHPKLALVEVNGLYFSEGVLPDERHAQYEMCEDLAHQGVTYCNRKVAEGALPDLPAALLRFQNGLKGKDWCNADQKDWIVKRVATLLALPVPANS